MAARKIRHCLVDLLGRQIGPKSGCEIKLGISRLPKQEIGNTVITASAHDQIGVGGCRRIKVRVDILGGNILFSLLRKHTEGMHELVARTVV